MKEEGTIACRRVLFSFQATNAKTTMHYRGILRTMFCKNSLSWDLKLVLEGLWLRLCSHRVLKACFYKNKNGVLVGKKHDEISSFNQDDFGKGWRVLGSVQQDAYGANEGSNG
jgi:hypothetical protein